MTCKQCGGKFDKHLAECPYCGALNYTGAEEQYMDHLQDIRQNLSDLGDDAQEEYKTHVKKAFTVVVGIICGIILFIALIAGLFFFMANQGRHKAEKEKKAMLRWQSTYYDELDQLYAKGKYEELSDFFNAHCQDEGYYPYAWEHFDFIMIYQNYSNFLAFSPYFEDGDLIDRYWALYHALFLLGIDDMDYMSFSDEERQIMKDWQEKAKKFLHETMELSDEEIEEVREKTKASGSDRPDSEKCRQYIQKKYDL